MARIDGPDDGIHGLHEFIRAGGNGEETLARGLRRAVVTSGAQQRDMCQVCAELVVDVAGDARAFALQRQLLLHFTQAPFEAAAGDEPRAGSHTKRAGEDSGADAPWRPPPWC